MKQARDFCPNQEIHPDTAKVYLKAWGEITSQYGIDRFSTALWNVLRRGKGFFPMPDEIEKECEAIKRIKFEMQPKIHIWQCGACDTTQASEKAENCHKCGNGYLGMKKLTDNSHQGWSAVDAKKHFERFRSNPEEFFLLDSLLPELKKRKSNAL